jgi:hypothetical protein
MIKYIFDEIDWKGKNYIERIGGYLRNMVLRKDGFKKYLIIPPFSIKS